MAPTIDARLARFPRWIGLVGGVSLVAFGVWAMVGPRSFFDTLATFDPYNQHLIQDIGAFQIGLGAVLLLAAVPRRPDALGIALEILVFILPWLWGWTDTIDPQFTRILFWFTGHPIVYFWLLPIYNYGRSLLELHDRRNRCACRIVCRERNRD